MPDFYCWTTDHDRQFGRLVECQLDAEDAARTYADMAYGESAGEVGLKFEVNVDSDPADGNTKTFEIEVDFEPTFTAWEKTNA